MTTMKARYHKMRVDGKQVCVHRYVMEQHLGHPLKRNEFVHHINGNRYDNRIENLRVILPGDHSRLHNKGRKHTEETKEKVRKSLLGNQRRKGILHTPEEKDRISQSMRIARKKKFWSTRKK